MTLSRVLVGDDGSPGAAAARAWAEILARGAGAEVIVSRVVEQAGGSGAVNQAGSEVNELTGPPAPALLSLADEVAADLLAVGRRGGGGFDSLRLGSTAHQVAEHALRPVAVVPATTVATSYRWPFAIIAVGHDGSEVATGALAWAAAAAALSSAMVVVVHALELGPAYAAAGLGDAYEQARARIAAMVDEWCAPLRDADVAYSTVVEEGGPAGVLLEAVGAREADLLVVGRRTPGLFPGMAMGSVAHRALGFAPCPTVVVPAAG
jgi:nucleotide-binding universal stress UspA family protein